MDALTPFQCFVAGAALALAAGGVLWFLAWRRLAELRERNPDFMANIQKEVQRRERREEQKALLDETAFDMRQREMELLERIAKNQEVMIDLLRQALSEKAIS